MMKTELGIKRKLPQSDKEHFWKIANTAKIIFNDEILNAFTLKSGERKECPLLQLLFNCRIQPGHLDCLMQGCHKPPICKKCRVCKAQ